MGPYCKFCNNRCFMHMPANTPQEALDAYGTSTIIATCKEGQQFELEKVGWNITKIRAAIEDMRRVIETDDYGLLTKDTS